VDGKKTWEKKLARNLALGGAPRSMGRNVSSVACLAFVALLGLAFWAGALWIGQFLLRMGASGF
jgi:hypothetical protein